MEELTQLTESHSGSPEDVLAGILRRLHDTSALVSTAILAPPTAAPVSTAAVAAILAAPLVRCADCRHVHYRSAPPARGKGSSWSEWVECDHGLEVTLRELEKPCQYCTMFNRRPPSRKET